MLAEGSASYPLGPGFALVASSLFAPGKSGATPVTLVEVTTTTTTTTRVRSEGHDGHRTLDKRMPSRACLPM